MLKEVIMESDLLKGKEVAAYCRVSLQHIYRLMKKGQFPAPVKIGGCTVRWRRATIDAWIDNPDQQDTTTKEN